MTPRRARLARGSPGPAIESEIESLDLEGRGIARVDGKVAFIDGALPGERVRWERVRSKSRFDAGVVTEVLRASSLRTKPRCVYFGLAAGSCGGCSMQHLDTRAQVSIKQRVLEDSLERIGKVRPETILRPISGLAWNYRHRARMTARYVDGKGAVLVGFHERASSYVADMRSCEILAEPVGRLIGPLRDLLGGLSNRQRLPQIEVAVAQGVTVLVLRVLEPLSDQDRVRLREFELHEGVHFWEQPGGPDTAVPLAGGAGAPPRALNLPLPEYGLQLPFRPTDFTQVNHRTNEILVRRALCLLDPGPDDAVADFFCGMGNFTLPIATRARHVIGLEGSETLLARAAASAREAGLGARTAFVARNLFEWTAADWQALVAARGGRIDRVLVDPPRDGALAVVQALGAGPPPRRMVYVSCNPATLARDCGYLVHQAGWFLRSAGIVNMFPHTSHVESIAVLEPGEAPARTCALRG